MLDVFLLKKNEVRKSKKKKKKITEQLHVSILF